MIEWGTHIAVGVLLIVAPVVFVWFLKDLYEAWKKDD